MRLTRKLTYGGNMHERKFREYAVKIKNREPINENEFAEFLKQIDEPLKIAIDYDNNGNKYTINEYALLHNAGYNIHALFWNYDVAIKHIVYYKKFDIDEPLTILEAYIVNGEYVENISRIINQIKFDRSTYFRTSKTSNDIPTILLYALDSSNYINGALHNVITLEIINMYMQPEFYSILTKNHDPNTIRNLISIAIRYNNPELMLRICNKIPNSETIYELIFTKQIVSFLLLQNNNTLFYETFILLKKLESSRVLYYINKYAIDPEKDASRIMEKFLYNQKYPNNRESKRFFEIIGLHILKDVLPPYIGKNVRIIIRSHGLMKSDVKENYSYPFNRLCFFVNKGEVLSESCFVSNRTENLVCNGNYDNNLKCVESTNGQIITEPMIFIFDSGMYKGYKNNYTGIYVCYNEKVERSDEINIDNDKLYEITDIIEMVTMICNTRRFSYENIDIMAFVCRSQYGNANLNVANIIPKITATNNSE